MHASNSPIPVALALYQPDIPQNAGTILRLGACMGVPVHVVGPAGFDLSDRALRRAGMDYLGHVEILRHVDWDKFESWRVSSRQRLILLTTRGDTPHVDHAFAAGDILMLGRESAGVPDSVHAAADARVVVPMRPGLRSLNVAATAAMVLGEALRQTGTFPGLAPLAEGV